MKNILYASILWMLVLFITMPSTAQTAYVPDQNPNFWVSQKTYMKIADSLNTWHSTTAQDTYKAIDFLADKQEARAQRKAARRELRLERARYGNYWYNDDYYSPGYYNNYYGNYNYNGYYNPYGYRSSWGNALWNTLPLITAVGLSSWWGCH